MIDWDLSSTSTHDQRSLDPFRSLQAEQSLHYRRFRVGLLLFHSKNTRRDAMSTA